MAVFNIQDIPDDYFFTKPVYLDTDLLIAAPETPITGELKSLLDEWEFMEVQSEGSLRETYGSEMEETGKYDGLHPDDRKRLLEAEACCQDLYKYTESLYAQITLAVPVEFKDLTEKIKELLDVLKSNRRYLLLVLSDRENAQGQNYLIAHVVNSTIISLIIGAHLKLPIHRLLELGAAALLHEAGMYRMPPGLCSQNRPLEAEEVKLMRNHPIEGYRILKASMLPPEIIMPALDHHERLDGKGYPRRLTGDKISFYSKIVAAACSYEAMTSKRPHRGAKDGHSSILDMLKNTNTQYDEVVVKALVFSVSLYPIGLYVLLSDGRKGQVVDVNPDNPRCPIVQILGETSPGGRAKTIDTSPEGLHITRALSREEVESS